MATATQTSTTWVTAEDFARRPDSGLSEELVRGQIVMSPLPGVRHGIVCNRLGKVLADFVDDRGLGYVVNNDSGVITSRNPDTVRGPDVSYYSFDRLPKGDPPKGYNPSPPELACEVLSPSDRWDEAIAKAGEYLGAGVLVVLVLDPEARTATVFEAAKAPATLGAGGVLRLDAALPGFEVMVERLFA